MPQNYAKWQDRKYEVSYYPKNSKIHTTTRVTATSPADARCKIRVVEGMVKFIDIKETEAA